MLIQPSASFETRFSPWWLWGVLLDQPSPVPGLLWCPEVTPTIKNGIFQCVPCTDWRHHRSTPAIQTLVFPNMNHILRVFSNGKKQKQIKVLLQNRNAHLRRSKLFFLLRNVSFMSIFASFFFSQFTTSADHRH